VVVNLVKNAAEHAWGGRIRSALRIPRRNGNWRPRLGADNRKTMVRGHTRGGAGSNLRSGYTTCAKTARRKNLAGRRPIAGWFGHYPLHCGGGRRPDSSRKRAPVGRGVPDRTACPEPLNPGDSSMPRGPRDAGHCKSIQPIARRPNTMLETVSKLRRWSLSPNSRSRRAHAPAGCDADAAVRSACAEIAASLGHKCRREPRRPGTGAQLLRGRAGRLFWLVNLPAGSSQGLELVSEVKLLYPQTVGHRHDSPGIGERGRGGMRCGARIKSDQALRWTSSTVLDRASASLSNRYATPSCGNAFA